MCSFTVIITDETKKKLQTKEYSVKYTFKEKTNIFQRFIGKFNELVKIY